jgi:anhydro-N-acetylmuramic acid kinase
MLAIGLMSGTSLDGVDAALVHLSGEPPAVELLAYLAVPYSADERQRILEAIERGAPRELALLNVHLGARFAEAARAVLDSAGRTPEEIEFVASHGQTVWHEPAVATLQLGDPAVIAERLGVTVVSDFRSRDIAAGGQGAPLVPLADALLFSSEEHTRAMLNIGGIANVTWLPAGGSPEDLVAFDTGPGVAIVDAVVRQFDPPASHDIDGQRAARGSPDRSTLDRLLTDPYFDEPPPKSTGRERFGDRLARDLVAALGPSGAGGSVDDCVATALGFTVASIADQLRRWLPYDQLSEVIVSGGGARNPTLVARLREELSETHVALFSDRYFDGDAKEAVAFALLGWLTLQGRAANVPAATGAAGPRVLGRITPA